MLFLRDNYHHMFKDYSCPLCAKPGQNIDSLCDTQQHLLQCILLNSNSELIDSNMHYDDIYEYDIIKQAKVTILLESKYKKRKQLEEKLN